MLNKKLLGSVSSLPSDANFENVSLLLSGDGTNGAQNNTFLDSSTNNFTITRNGNTTQGSFSPYGSNWGNYFDGDGDGLTSATSSGFAFGTGDFTYEGWYFSLDSGSSLRGMFDTRASQSSTAGILMREDSGTFLVFVNGSTLFTGGTRTANTWQHIALVRQSGTIRLYVNGVQATSASSSQNFTDTNCRISGFIDTQASPYGYFGCISNARVVKGTCLYPSGTTFTPSTTPLTAISGTSLLTCQSNRFIDTSSNALAITVNGSPSVQRFSPFNPTAPYDTSVIGGSGYFDGSGDWLGFTDSSNVLDLGGTVASIEAWVWFNSLSGTARQVMVKSGGESNWNATNGFEWQVATYDGTLAFGYNNGGNPASLNSSVTPNINCWNHIAVATDASNNISFYLNGVRTGTATNAITKPTSRTLMRIANDLNDNFLNGYISDLRIIKGSGAYNPTSTTITVPTAPLTAVTNTAFLTSFQNAGIPDLAMQNNLETVGNAQVSTSVKKYGTGSLRLNTSSDRLLLPSNQGLALGSGNFTIEGWLYPTATQDCMVFQISTASTGYNASTSNTVALYFGTNAWDLYAANTNTSTSASISINTWYHFAVVRSSGTTKLYINGTSISSVSDSVNYTGSYMVFGTVYNNTYGMNGYLDDFRITKGLARYTANFTPPASALPSF